MYSYISIQWYNVAVTASACSRHHCLQLLHPFTLVLQLLHTFHLPLPVHLRLRLRLLLVLPHQCSSAWTLHITTCLTRIRHTNEAHTVVLIARRAGTGHGV